jgi:hypothetical protein
MEDYDFFMAARDTVSHYSRHVAQFEKHLEVHPSIGYSFEIGPWSIAPSAGILYRTRKWSGRDGYTQYPNQYPEPEPWTEDTPMRDVYGTIISYEEDIWFPEISLYVGFSFRDRLEIELGGSWYPYFEIATIDTHVLRLLQFYDSMKGGKAGLIGLTLRYYPFPSDKKLAFTLNGGYEGIYANKGTSTPWSVGSYNESTIKGAAGQSSCIESNLWWVTFYFTFFPAQIWSR